LRQAAGRRKAGIEKLAAIKAQAKASPTSSGSRAPRRALEPALVAEPALLSPSTGVIDSHAFMLALRGGAGRHDAMIAPKTPVLSGRTTERGARNRDWRLGADADQSRASFLGL
jgi:L-2-hydroxyglutarate oxidase LhgO